VIRSLAALLLALGVAAPAAALAQPAPAPARRASLHLGSTPWSPFTNAAGKPRYAIELVESALRRLDITAETEIVPEGSLTAAINDGRFDGSAALWRDPAREEKLVFSKPYLENRLVLVANKGVDVSAPALPALAGRKVALVDGYAYGDSLQSSRGPTYVPARTVEESLEKVLKGEADYVLMDELVVEYLVANHPEQVKARLAIGTEPLVVKTLHFALRRNVPGAEGIVKRFDEEVTKMIADHSYHRLLRVGWMEADVDGDGRTELVPASERAGTDPPVRRYELVTVSAPAAKPPGEKRFFIGGQVYEGWTNVPDRYKQLNQNRTAWGSQVAPVFSFKW
jgi:polar amino acid transport system substrate-binding protein